ncbi:unnamed protein product [Moneuplotes crassus]|uniref:Uncharacterized protein n=1 Tax=Euplotes crassus TaxID=5936 RepID=A0AAD1U196_EUPCR|nr:unnamed protein product [Moneuplotes crassus]
MSNKDYNSNQVIISIDNLGAKIKPKNTESFEKSTLFNFQSPKSHKEPSNLSFQPKVVQFSMSKFSNGPSEPFNPFKHKKQSTFLTSYKQKLTKKILKNSEILLHKKTKNLLFTKKSTKFKNMGNKRKKKDSVPKETMFYKQLDSNWKKIFEFVLDFDSAKAKEFRRRLELYENAKTKKGSTRVETESWPVDLDDNETLFKIIYKKRKKMKLTLKEKSYLNHFKQIPTNLLSIREGYDICKKKQTQIKNWIIDLKSKHEVDKTRDSLLKKLKLTKVKSRCLSPVEKRIKLDFSSEAHKAINGDHKPKRCASRNSLMERHHQVQSFDISGYKSAGKLKTQDSCKKMFASRLSCLKMRKNELIMNCPRSFSNIRDKTKAIDKICSKLTLKNIDSFQNCREVLKDDSKAMRIIQDIKRISQSYIRNSQMSKGYDFTSCSPVGSFMTP